MSMKNYLLLTNKPWHDELFQNLKHRKNEQWHHVGKKKNFNRQTLEDLAIDKIFIPHWSHIIPESIFNNYECIVFHMTDLPYGRGGSPLQNLIVKGNTTTKISAIRINQGIDTGDVYLKKELLLLGTAQEIFLRASDIMESMIVQIIGSEIKPVPQEGEGEIFKRRKPTDGDISELAEIMKVYDFIRMLDCEGYPPAFLETSHFRFEFNRASLQSDQSILADVRIIKK